MVANLAKLKVMGDDATSTPTNVYNLPHLSHWLKAMAWFNETHLVLQGKRHGRTNNLPHLHTKQRLTLTPPHPKNQVTHNSQFSTPSTHSNIYHCYAKKLVLDWRKPKNRVKDAHRTCQVWQAAWENVLNVSYIYLHVVNFKGTNLICSLNSTIY